MRDGATKLCKDNEKQMEMVKTIIKDVVRRKITKPDTVVVNSLENAIRFYNNEKLVAVPDASSLVEYVTTIIRIHDNNGKWCISRKRDTAKMNVISDVYHDIFGENISIGLCEEDSDQPDSQINVECLLSQEDLMEQESDELKTESDDDLLYPEWFDIWRSDLYMFLKGSCESFAFADGKYTIVIDGDVLERRFINAYRKDR